MLYNEEEVVRICKKYGIKMVEKEGYPLYKGEEMDENFPISQIFDESEPFYEAEPSLISTVNNLHLTISVPIINDKESCYSSTNYLLNNENHIKYNKEISNNKTFSSISCDNKNKYAA